MIKQFSAFSSCPLQYLQRTRLRRHMMTIGCSIHPYTSHRIQVTDEPCIVKTKRLVSGTEGTMSLAQGIVHWSPPVQATEAAKTMLSNASINSYGPDEGLPALRDALRTKVSVENGLENHNIMVTAGANQAFANVVLALLDAGDNCVLFKPHYFNHAMALSMTGVQLVSGPCDPKTWHPDLEWLKGHLESNIMTKMVVICNPCNPTGVALTQIEVSRAAELCQAAGAWLVLDNTYENFMYDGRKHFCASGSNIINIFSFSKAYGMMGWRVGYIAYPDNSDLAMNLLKVQDTIPICPTQISQHVALGALEAGHVWVSERVKELERNRIAILQALEPLGGIGNGVAGGEGAIYLWARLPAKYVDDDNAVVEWLVKKHKVCVIPGSACGQPGCIRVAFANLPSDKCCVAADALRKGLEELISTDSIVPLSGQ